MDNKIEVFTHEKFGDIRTMLIDGEPWFVGKDVAIVLGYNSGKSYSNVIAKYIDAEDKGVTKLMTPGGMQSITIINESGLYSLILSSKKPAAKEFKRWVTSEVLPTIRKHGFYATDDILEQMLNDPDMAIGAFKKLKAERELRKKLEKENMVLNEKVTYLDVITSSRSAIPITVIAKDYGMTATKLNSLLHFLRIQYQLKKCGTWVLYREYEDLGYTKSVTFEYDKTKHKTCVHTLWTQAGRMFLYDKLKEQNILPLCERSAA